MRVFLVLIFITATAHAQWTIEDSHTAADLRGIHNVGGGIVWASGTNGTVLRSEDGGYLWQTCTIPPGAEKLDFRGIQAFDANTAIVMSSGKGDLSRLYKTTDGCATWKLVFTNPDKDGFWDAIQFGFSPVRRPTSEYGRGLIFGDPVDGKFAIYITSNKGSDWRSALGFIQPAVAHPGETIFAASNSAAVVPGSNGDMAFVTGGSGGARFIFDQYHDPCDCKPTHTFSSFTLPISSNDTTGAFSIARRNRGKYASGLDLPHRAMERTTFMVVGGDYTKPDEAGISLFISCANCFSIARGVRKPVTPPHGYRSAVAYDASTNTWITVGPNGTDISTDDGRNWRALKPGPADTLDADKNWNALSLPYVVGPKGRIGKLTPDALTPQKP